MKWVIAKRFGGFIRWLLKGRKTSLSDEVNGRFPGTWPYVKDYGLENLIIGIITSSIIIGFVVLIFF